MLNPFAPGMILNPNNRHDRPQHEPCDRDARAVARCSELVRFWPHEAADPESCERHYEIDRGAPQYGIPCMTPHVPTNGVPYKCAQGAPPWRRLWDPRSRCAIAPDAITAVFKQLESKSVRDAAKLPESGQVGVDAHAVDGRSRDYLRHKLRARAILDHLQRTSGGAGSYADLLNRANSARAAEPRAAPSSPSTVIGPHRAAPTG